MAEGDMDRGTIEFLNIAPGTNPAEPRPAHEYIPDWYEDLDYEKDTGHFDRTVKSCIPFMEAMTVGWIIPVPHDIGFRVGEDGLSISIKKNEELLAPHEIDQLGGDDHPELPAVVLKFRTPWVASTPDGYSTLFIPPMNRAEPRWRPFSGIIDTDVYSTTISAPSLWLQPGFEGTIERGTPLLQAIPFERKAIGLDGRTRDATEGERKRVAQTLAAIGETESPYQRNFWVPKVKDRKRPE